MASTPGRAVAAADAAATTRVTRIRIAACVAALVSCIPYVVLKVAWLLGSSIGSATAAGAAELHDDRHIAGNVVTLAMALVAVALALALTHPRGHDLPAAVLVLPVWVGSGLLAPIALGLPLGIIGQSIAGGGSSAAADNGLDGWVYAVVYGGFSVQAVALMTAFALHARVRWPALFRLRMRALTPTSQRLTLTHLSAAATALYALANLTWAVAGQRLAAPPDFDTVAQRSLLVSTGLLALAGAFAVLQLAHRPRRRWAVDRLAVLVAVAWVGSATSFASGVAQYALATEAPDPATTLVLAIGTISGVSLGAAALSITDATRRGARAAGMTQ
jgi:hypothetical protein